MVKELIKVRDLNLHFKELHVLKSINMEIYDKTVTSVIGPSGCGKSTYLRCFNRMNDLKDAAIDGEIILDEENIYSRATDVTSLRMKVGMVFQKPNPFPKSIFENTAFGLKIQGKMKGSEIEGRVEQSLRDVWLWDEVKDRLKDSAMSLSGGQQQRLCMARALATNPEIILLDEPTSALDPRSTNKIEELCVELKKEVTILIVTHNIAQAARISDYTAFLYLGELVEYGETKLMFTVPKDKKTEEYISGKFG
ncbi:TPA: phosphate ABC transporter ATP-binding protein [candidate division WOR-3 bacterium]|uniref:Phosphate ABC transporter ATP-binding protein n=1 Tax=candidate division WOR-3 bacterium TaxID=2052148 RepID=A0A350HA60_UNCW3|nr:phosphate ABC transporter ATP-binding protein [candidate division WOR-3 bacterium]